ncbi:MAG: class I SAM-dependent methyltransferase [Christensenellaceae bacterium]|jgi:O-methyltransferase involved in polyketide biosynthesis|nr:class I SAM-dependent methyltransferase [Christensenellaceae bacterium]
MSNIDVINSELINNDTVSSTLFLPLYGRMIASKKFPDILTDTTAEKLCNTIPYDFSKLKESYGSEYTTACCLIRAYRNDCYIKEYLKKHPNGVIINLGAGLDDTFTRIDNGRVNWYNIDLPNVIEYREHYIPKQPRTMNIRKSIFDYTWLNDIKTNESPVLIIAEGLFMYFTHEEIKELFNRIISNFQRGHLYFEAFSKKGIDYANKIVKKTGNLNSEMRFWINKPNEILTWSKRIKSATCTPYFDDFSKYKKFKFSTRFIMKITDISKRSKFVTIVW